MIIIEQIWEKRNLGIISAELRFENSDTVINNDFNIVDLKKYDYLLARIPVGRMDIAYAVQKKGFHFAETSIELSVALKNLTLPKIFEEYEKLIEVHEADKTEIELIYNSIQNGIFDTDKIALDPEFGIKKSGNRFYNWCKEEIEKGSSKAYLVSYAGEKLGFYVVKDENERTANSLLAGLFEKNKNPGLGYAVLYHPLLTAKICGKRKMITAVSSNNPASVKMHLALGYEIKTMNYVFVKHLKLMENL